MKNTKKSRGTLRKVLTYIGKYRIFLFITILLAALTVIFRDKVTTEQRVVAHLYTVVTDGDAVAALKEYLYTVATTATE